MKNSSFSSSVSNIEPLVKYREVTSAALVDGDYTGRRVLVGYNSLLTFGFSSDGRWWDWVDEDRFLDWEPLCARQSAVIKKAFRRGSQIHILLEIERSSNQFEKQMVVVDAAEPWKMLDKFVVCDESTLERSVTASSPVLERVVENPIISPRSENDWESFTTLNPTAIQLGGRVHLLYRAQGPDYISSIGYASSLDGVTIDQRLNKPVFQDLSLGELARQGRAQTTHSSAGGLGGTEDPRATVIDDKVVMTYVAYNGWSPPRLAITSIKVDDFMRHRWRWRKPVYISPSNYVDKSGVLFPQKIRGKYVMMHRIFPDIQIDYLDDIDFDGSRFIETKSVIRASSSGWDSRKIGAGAPPLWTEEGWLLIYYGVDDQFDNFYHMGAMLLDLENPEKVLYRCSDPILSPKSHYEMSGFKPGIVYPCGATILNETLFVYYGAADNYVAVAKAPLREFLDQLMRCREPLRQIYSQTIAEDWIQPDHDFSPIYQESADSALSQ